MSGVLKLDVSPGQSGELLLVQWLCLYEHANGRQLPLRCMTLLLSKNAERLLFAGISHCIALHFTGQKLSEIHTIHCLQGQQHAIFHPCLLVVPDQLVCIQLRPLVITHTYA